MALATPSLRLYSSVLRGASPVGNITKQFTDWGRSIRFYGGYWLGKGYYNDDSISALKDFFYTQLGAHLVERTAGMVTWEGMIYDMDDSEIASQRRIPVSVCGYIFTCNWRYVSVADETTGNASDYIDDIASTDCPFVATRIIRSNTLQIPRFADVDQRAWDEMLRVTQLGDASADLWRLYMGNDRTLVYEPANVQTPRYYARGGIIRRRSLDDMWNWTQGFYTDENDQVQVLTPASQAQSIARYGRKEFNVVDTRLATATMEAMRDLYLSDNAWPWGRPIGTAPEGVTLYASDSRRATEVNPWEIRPDLIRDLGYQVGTQEIGSQYPDSRDFIPDEVSVDASGKLAFRALDFEEGELLEAQAELQEETAQAQDQGAGADRLNWRRKWAEEFKKLGIDPWKDKRSKAELIELARRERRRRG